jgi:hypothetical protein
MSIILVHNINLSENTRTGFKGLVSAADRTTLLCNTIIKPFFKINFGSSPTLSIKPTKYLGFLVVTENLETRSK